MANSRQTKLRPIDGGKKHGPVLGGDGYWPLWDLRNDPQIVVDLDPVGDASRCSACGYHQCMKTSPGCKGIDGVRQTTTRHGGSGEPSHEGEPIQNDLTIGAKDLVPGVLICRGAGSFDSDGNYIMPKIALMLREYLPSWEAWECVELRMHTLEPDTGVADYWFNRLEIGHLIGHRVPDSDLLSTGPVNPDPDGCHLIPRHLIGEVPSTEIVTSEWYGRWIRYIYR